MDSSCFRKPDNTTHNNGITLVEDARAIRVGAMQQMRIDASQEDVGHHLLTKPEA